MTAADQIRADFYRWPVPPGTAHCLRCEKPIYLDDSGVWRREATDSSHCPRNPANDGHEPIPNAPLPSGSDRRDPMTDTTLTDTAYVLLTERCTERATCSGRTRYSELTDDENTHWHVKSGLPLVTVESIVAARVADRDALVRWKGEAMQVLADWERVWEALGQPGTLGASKAEAVLAEVQRLADRDNWWREQLRDAMRHPHKGPDDTDASMAMAAADRLERGYPAGGSNTTQTVARILRACAALAAEARTQGGAS